MIHEQNRFPGVTNRVLAPLVGRIAVSFAGTAGVVGRRGRITGNPVRPEFARLEPWRPGDGPACVLLFGGSRGARALNGAMVDALPHLPPGMEIRHQTGPADHRPVSEAYVAMGIQNARVEPYIDDMPGALAAADLVICRAGASTLAELAVAGRASVLIPFPHAAHDHQRHNARGFVEAGAARMMDQRNLDGMRLAAIISDLVGDAEALGTMAACARRLARPGAAAEIADMAEHLLEEAA